MVQKLTIEQARENSANFMYIFASEAFLNAIPRSSAKIIRLKQVNQNKLILLSAAAYGGTREEYVQAISDGFVDTYGCTPYEALITLAQGGQVAGKNWSEGVYGIGSLSNKFVGSNVTVDPKTGAMSNNGVAMKTTDIITDEVKGKTINYQLFAKDEETGKVYMSQYNKTLKKYYAQSYTTSEGKKYSAYGTAISNADSGTVWESIFMSLQTFLDWLISLFSGEGTNKEQLSAANTLPNQKTDGFVYQSGFGEAGTILLLLAGGGALIASGALKKTTK